MVFAYLRRWARTKSLVTAVIFVICTALFIASANYVINDCFDRKFVRHYPKKFQRTAVQHKLRGDAVMLDWLVFVNARLKSACMANVTLTASVLTLHGLVYNVLPVRAKDKPYLDVRNLIDDICLYIRRSFQFLLGGFPADISIGVHIADVIDHASL